MAHRRNLENQLETIRINDYRLFIFDFDGTLVETLDVDWQAMKKALCRLLQISWEPSFTLAQLVSRATTHPILLTQTFKIISQYEARGLPHLEWRLPMLHFIHKLKGQGKKLAIFSTNMRATVESALCAQNLDKAFACIISKENVQHYKPDPEGLLIILRQLGLPASQACLIGDKEVDLRAGQRAQIDTILCAKTHDPT